MTAWDELLAVTHPGMEVEIPTTGDRWLMLRRRYEMGVGDLSTREDYMTLTVELVRAGSAADPRRLPADAPRPTPPMEGN